MINYCEAMGRSRAAAELTRQGFHKEAKALMIKGDPHAEI